MKTAQASRRSPTADNPRVPRDTVTTALRPAGLRIAMISPRYAPYIGGVETHVMRLATHLTVHGHRVHVLTQAHDPSLPPTETIEGVRVHRFPTMSLARSHNFVAAPGLWGYLACHNDRYDLIHAHSYHALPALGAAFAHRCPVVFTPHYHGTGHSRARRLLHAPYRAIGAAIFRRAGAVICVSAPEADLVRQHFPWVADRISVIPNGVDVAALRDAAPFAEQRTVILSVGRLEAYKNVHLTIAALAHLDQSFILRIIGDGPDRPRLEQLVDRLGLRDRVVFLGRLSDEEVRRWFRTARVYVSMSAHEAFGITLYEAVAAGASVVASDIPAYQEIAAGSGAYIAVTGLQTTPAQLAQLIHSAAEVPPTMAVPRAVPAWTAVTEQTIALYRTMMHDVHTRCSIP